MAILRVHNHASGEGSVLVSSEDWPGACDDGDTAHSNRGTPHLSNDVWWEKLHAYASPTSSSNSSTNASLSFAPPVLDFSLQNPLTFETEDEERTCGIGIDRRELGHIRIKPRDSDTPIASHQALAAHLLTYIVSHSISLLRHVNHLKMDYQKIWRELRSMQTKHLELTRQRDHHLQLTRQITLKCTALTSLLDNALYQALSVASKVEMIQVMQSGAKLLLAEASARSIDGGTNGELAPLSPFFYYVLRERG